MTRSPIELFWTAKKKSRRHGLRREREIGRWQRMVVAGLVLMPYWSFVRPYSAAAACPPE